MPYNRDIIIYTRVLNYSINTDKYVMALDALLQQHESLENFSQANEIININSNKVITKSDKVRTQILKRVIYKPFVFLSCKN